MAENLDSLGDHADWTVQGDVATYQPNDLGWSARVRASGESKYYAHWHVAIIDPFGRAHWVMHASQLAEAARVAESRVRGLFSAAEQRDWPPTR